MTESERLPDMLADMRARPDLPERIAAGVDRLAAWAHDAPDDSTKVQRVSQIVRLFDIARDIKRFGGDEYVAEATAIMGRFQVGELDWDSAGDELAALLDQMPKASRTTADVYLCELHGPDARGKLAHDREYHS